MILLIYSYNILRFNHFIISPSVISLIIHLPKPLIHTHCNPRILLRPGAVPVREIRLLQQLQRGQLFFLDHLHQGLSLRRRNGLFLCHVGHHSRLLHLRLLATRLFQRNLRKLRLHGPEIALQENSEQGCGLFRLSREQARATVAQTQRGLFRDPRSRVHLSGVYLAGAFEFPNRSRLWLILFLENHSAGHRAESCTLYEWCA